MELKLKYKRKRIKKVIKLPPICVDYEPREGSDWCKKAALCKNASSAWEGIELGHCRGGTDPEEREKMQKKFAGRTAKKIG